MVAEKTGSLIATSGRLGALLVGRLTRDRRGADRVRRSASASRSSSPTTCSTSPACPAESGKTPGTDLREGIRTLPVLFAEQDGLVLPEDLSDDGVLAGALQTLRGSAAIERARAELVAEAEAARAQLAGLPDVPSRRRPRGALRLRGDPHRLSPEPAPPPG